MAQDYLKVEGMDDMELIGEKYFENLRVHSFLEDIERSESDGSITRYKMHNIVHDFARSLTNNECFIVDAEHSVKYRSRFVHKKAQHLMILGNSIPNSSYSKKKLHSLIVDSEFEFKVSKLFGQLTYLRSLDLSYCSSQVLPREIRKLIHLRYLKLSENRYLKELPDELCELYNLQTLDLTKCLSLQKLPKKIGRLINLRYLKNVKTYSLSYMPKGMERLTCLRELSEFVRSTGGRGHDTLECLGNMVHLKGSLVLRRLGNVVSAEEAEKAKLNVKKNLTDLSLSFYKLESIGERKSEHDNIVLDALQPPLNLEKLRIDEFDCKSMFPPWLMSLAKLKMLTLHSCMNLERFPDPLGKLPSLESLNIRYNNGLKSLTIKYMEDREELNLGVQSNNTSMVIFPKLKYLTIKHMEEWEDWIYEIIEKSLNKVIIMPVLCSLELVSCPKLKKLPDDLPYNPTLEKLTINHCSVNKLGIFSCETTNTFSKLKVLSLGGCMDCECLPPLGKLPSLESLFIKYMESVGNVGHDFLGIKSAGTSIGTVFPKLQTLEFEDMTEWKNWVIPKEDGVILPCLRSLTIKLCDKLKLLPERLFQLKTLEALNIYNCRVLRQRFKKNKGDDWPKISRMTTFKIE
ncbi:putative disease resistance RPP13-like protein 1 [Pistacia vera]|uniref:putative disease resistance RPP13-like protein 1 n=1 Tax=Pistacia vera TaxID=55513 RepID=UPI001262B840|nr:putative disease resistance RPP13-like protein 1 [Pistacia vera]